MAVSYAMLVFVFALYGAGLAALVLLIKVLLKVDKALAVWLKKNNDAEDGQETQAAQETLAAQEEQNEQPNNKTDAL